MSINSDKRIVMTLDAGGTSFRFSAMRSGVAITDTITLPSDGENLSRCLSNIATGFTRVKDRCPETPVAISFAFPGPADYPRGIIGDLGNLSGFRGGVALGPMLEEKFGIPVFINNDGDLFVYGEAIAGLLPHVNGLLEKAGSPKRYNNLFGVTLGTGFGGGIVRNGELFIGDNSVAGEVWLLRNKRHPSMNAEEGACMRAIRRVYAKCTATSFELAPDPRDIALIATGKMPGDQNAAIEAYRQLGEIVGDAMGNALTLIDGLGVIGGGIANGHPLFLHHVVSELNSTFETPTGQVIRRLASHVFNLEDPHQLETFLRGETREITVPGCEKTLQYDPLQRLGVGISRLGTSEAIAIGAYAFALGQLGTT
jgi:glucokinase